MRKQHSKAKKKMLSKINDGGVNHFLFCKKPSTIQEICSHQQLQRNLRGNGKFWNLGTAVGVSYFVHEVRTHFGQHMGTIVNNRELKVCPCQLNNTEVCHFTKVVEMERLVLTVLAICSEYVQNAQKR